MILYKFNIILTFLKKVFPKERFIYNKSLSIIIKIQGDKMEYVTLSNDVKIPQLGFGVFLIPKDQTKEVVLNAIDVGYRHFECVSWAYPRGAGPGRPGPVGPSGGGRPPRPAASPGR